MEHSPILDTLHENFHTTGVNPAAYSPLTLAYLGDAVYDLIIRTLFVEQKNMPAKKLHQKTIQLVKAKAQAELILAIEDELSEDELAVFKRGRNAKASSVAKNADIHDYRNATGFESLCGYLYLSQKLDRVMELIYTGFIRLHLMEEGEMKQ